MIALDVNVCVSAMRPETPRARQVKDWLDDRLRRTETVGVSELVLSSVIRITTHHRVYARPSSGDEAIEFCDALRAAPPVVLLRPGPRNWDIFSTLVTRHRLRANEVADAYHAALAIEHGAAFATLDRGFATFEGLQTLDPLAKDD